MESPEEGRLLDGLLNELDLGEASAIALAVQNPNSLLVLDDLAARKVAHRRNLPFIGTLGVLTRAKSMGVIGSVTPYKQRLIENGFRASLKILDEWLGENGEPGSLP